MIRVPGMLLIGSTGRDAGKTEFACAVLRTLHDRHGVVAVKVTTQHGRPGECVRGGQRCGACGTLDGPYDLKDEKGPGRGKDTQRMLAAGAGPVYWLRVSADHLKEGAKALFEIVATDAIVVCESNSLRRVVEPDLFVMCRREDGTTVKDSARRARPHVDRVITFDGNGFDIAPEAIDVVEGRWALSYPAAAIVLAGGKSTRMGLDKALLDVGGRSMLERACTQVAPHFERVLVSANDAAKYALTGLDVVEDESPGRGPLMGIASALDASRHDVNFVVACDIPVLDWPLLRRMVRLAADYDAVVPMTPAGRFEPLFAVYRKSMLRPIRAALAAGERKVSAAFARGKVKYVPVAPDTPIRNLNTPRDYEEFLADSGRGLV